MANEIQELKFQVGEAWKGVYSSSTAYGLANVVQDPTGLSIYRSLKSGNVGHPLSNASWWFRIIDLSSIKAESDRIAALNQAIAQDEALRVAAEELRQQHEAERVAAETQRNEAEQARISAEQARVNAESARATAEQQRITAEQGRVSAESARVQAEQARVLAETLRANAEDQRAANEQNRVAAEQQRIERAEQDHQRAESDHAAYIDSLGAFDISSYHATDGVLAKYADLTAALGTNGANIPDDLRKGGMSVKFVQSSDNKYVQYMCKNSTWSSIPTDWEKVTNVSVSQNALTIDGEYKGELAGRIITNPEFLGVLTDNLGRIIVGVRPNGKVYYGFGVPTQVIDYIEERIKDLSLDEYEDIVAFINGLEEGDKTLIELLNEKVDKTDGKSLIDSNYAFGVKYISNPEFALLFVDNNGYISFGIRPNNDFYFGFGVPSQIKEYAQERIDGKALIDAFYAATKSVESNPEYFEVKIDRNGVLIESIDNGGNKTIYKDLKIHGKFNLNGNVFKADKYVDMLSAVIDSMGVILSYYKPNGVKVEKYGLETPIIKTEDISLGEQAQNKIKELIYDDGDILALHPPKVVLPVLQTFKRRLSHLSPYENNYRYVNFNLLWFSDMHHVDRRLARISKFYDAYKDYIDDVVCTGDAQDSYPEDFTYWGKNGGASFLDALGNHECFGPQRTNPYEDNKILAGWISPGYSQKECYEKYFKDYLNDTNIVIEENKTYWYKDHILPARDANDRIVEGAYAYKIRIIGIDYYHWKESRKYTDNTSMTVYPDGQPLDTGQQQLWLRNTLEEARTNGFSVICLIHNPVTIDNFNPENTPFQTAAPYLMSNAFSNDKLEILDEVQTFINNGGNFITWLTGHTHDNRFGTIKSHPDQLMITVGTSGNRQNLHSQMWEFQSLYASPKGTIGDDLFNIVSINTYGGIISLYRVGSNYDKSGKYSNTIAYDYINKQII